MESLFGAEMPLPVKFFLAFLFVLAVIGVVFWIVRMFGFSGQRLEGMRGRQPRLAVIDAAMVDGRRRLILIRRDNIEHLLMIGGPTDIVIEPNIVRVAQAGRDAPVPQRPPAAADTLPRAAPLGETAAWPLQPESPPRPLRGHQPEETESWPQEAEPTPQPATPAPRRAVRAADPLAGLAAEATRFPEPRGPDISGPGAGFAPREVGRQREAVREREAEREPPREGPREREPARLREPSLREPSVREAESVRERASREGARVREAQPAPPEDFNADADQNLADMAQRLEAALRRPKSGEARAADPRTVTAEAEAAPPPPPPPQRPAPPEPKPGKSLYDSLEKEMASLLGRPSGKS